MPATQQRDAKTMREPAVASARPQRFRVMRQFPLSMTEDAKVGTIIEQGPDWPYNRARQFVDQGVLAPIVTEEG